MIFKKFTSTILRYGGNNPKGLQRLFLALGHLNRSFFSLNKNNYEHKTNQSKRLFNNT